MVLEVIPNETISYVCVETFTTGNGVTTRQFESITINITIPVITVQFAERHYVGTESSRVMMVRVVITSGSFSSAVIATVQPSQLSPVSANGGGVDFDSDPVVATFQPNQDSTTVRIPLVCDTEVEGKERFNITLSANLPVILGARSTAIGVIEDSTVVVSFGMASYSFAEDDTSASVDITLNQAHNAPLSVDVISEDLTAIARMDYSRLQSLIPIPAGSRSVSVLVNIIKDNILEQTETFRLNITRLLTGGFCGATIGRISTEISITVNDGPPYIDASTSQNPTVMDGIITVQVGNPVYIIESYNDVSIICNVVRGKLPITFSWYFNEEQCRENVSTITVTVPNPKDGDVFTCRVDNQCRNDTRNATVRSIHKTFCIIP